MIIQIPLGTGSKLKNFELKMALRSIEKHVANVDGVVIVGEKPDWITNIEYIQFPDTKAIPDHNIALKTMEALKKYDQVLHWHDDHIALVDFDANNFPYFYWSTLEAYVKSRGLDLYGRRANNTLNILKGNRPTKFFDIHTPITYEREAFINATKDLDWNSDGYILKSLYANSLQIEGTTMRDYKSLNPPQMPCKIFSTMPHLRASVQRFLLEQFPKKSKYEI